ncbi:hypothetical protein QM012_009396 [Aureobasidium pullulans]|uniref:Uncharacterized protein n=1 Tax=Aureobasidium pullulans TaxID=5580 RepID=A0ABR0TI37_AURPU
MADLKAAARRSDDENLLRIKADAEDLLKQQHEIQRQIDSIKARIDREGPTATLETQLERDVAEQKVVCIRSDIAVSIIGSSIEDLTQTSRNPPSVVAVRKLLNSMENFDNEASLESVGLIPAVQTQNTAESLTDVFEDFESAFDTAPKEFSLRTTEILQETQLAVRILATDPLDRWIAREDAKEKARQTERQREQQSTFLSTADLLVPQGNRAIDPPSWPSGLSHFNSISRIDDRSSGVQDIQAYLDVLLTRAPPNHIREALQKLDPMFKSGSEGCTTREADDKGNQALGSSGMHKSGHEQIDEVVIDVQSKINEILSHVRAFGRGVQTSDQNAGND